MPILLQIVLGISAPAIACFGAYVSYRQWQLGKYKLKHDLFEKRWLIYATAHDAIALFLNGSEEEKLNQFKNLKVKIVGAQSHQETLPKFFVLQQRLSFLLLKQLLMDELCCHQKPKHPKEYLYLKQQLASLNCHRFSQISWFINISTSSASRMIGK